jgi:hypothetical protein
MNFAFLAYFGCLGGFSDIFEQCVLIRPIFAQNVVRVTLCLPVRTEILLVAQFGNSSAKLHRFFRENCSIGQSFFLGYISKQYLHKRLKIRILIEKAIFAVFDAI